MTTLCGEPRPGGGGGLLCGLDPDHPGRHSWELSVQRFRRKPEPRSDEDQFAARYEPTQPLDGLRAVARMAGDEAEVIEAVFPSGKRLLLAWFLWYDDHHPAKPDYVTVEAGNYLAYSPGRESLYASGDANWRQFYDLVTGDLP